MGKAYLNDTIFQANELKREYENFSQKVVFYFPKSGIFFNSPWQSVSYVYLNLWDLRQSFD